MDPEEKPYMRVAEGLEDELPLELPREPQSVVLEGLDEPRPFRFCKERRLVRILDSAFAFLKRSGKLKKRTLTSDM